MKNEHVLKSIQFLEGEVVKMQNALVVLRSLFGENAATATGPERRARRASTQKRVSNGSIKVQYGAVAKSQLIKVMTGERPINVEGLALLMAGNFKGTRFTPKALLATLKKHKIFKEDQSGLWYLHNQE